MTTPPRDRWDHDAWLGAFRSTVAFAHELSVSRLMIFAGGPSEPGKYNTAKGGFVTGIDMFDAYEFGIRKEEAEWLDPTIRQIMEVAHQVNFIDISLAPALIIVVSWCVGSS